MHKGWSNVKVRDFAAMVGGVTDEPFMKKTGRFCDYQGSIYSTFMKETKTVGVFEEKIKDHREMRRHFVNWILSQPPTYEPGSQFEYSNFGYGIIGAVLERLYEKENPQNPKPFNYIKQQILHTLGMKSNYGSRIGRANIWLETLEANVATAEARAKEANVTSAEGAGAEAEVDEPKTKAQEGLETPCSEAKTKAQEDLETSCSEAKTNAQEDLETARSELDKFKKLKADKLKAKASGNAIEIDRAAKELADAYPPYDYSDRVMGHTSEPPPAGGKCMKKRSPTAIALRTLPGMCESRTYH